MHGRNHRTSHPVNLMLNYAYAVLESQVRIATAAESPDSTIGYLRTCRPGRVALVFDLMDSPRPKVNWLVINFVRSHRFRPSDFVLSHSGICKLSPQLV